MFRKYRYPHPTSAPSGHLLPEEGGRRENGESHLSPFCGRGMPKGQRVGFLFCGEAASSLPFPRGEGFISGIALLSYRCLPHWGRGTASAVDRVLSYIVDLRRSFPLFFIPLSPSNLRPFGAPPSIGRRECPREPLPLEGAAERSEAGLASFFAAKPPPLCLPSWERRCVEKSGIPVS